MKKSATLLLSTILSFCSVALPAAQVYSSQDTLPASTMYGDLNADNKVNSRDYLLMKQYLLGTADFPISNGATMADVSDDKKISSTDLLLIRGYILGNVDKFPADKISIPTPPSYTVKGYVTAERDADENGLVAGRFKFYTKTTGSLLADGYNKINFTVSGTATNGVDYELIPTQVYAVVGSGVFTPPSDAPLTYIDIIPISDQLVEGDETVTITLDNGESATLVIKDLLPTPDP